jgi:hypothetical protein
MTADAPAPESLLIDHVRDVLGLPCRGLQPDYRAAIDAAQTAIEKPLRAYLKGG